MRNLAVVILKDNSRQIIQLKPTNCGACVYPIIEEDCSQVAKYFSNKHPSNKKSELEEKLVCTLADKVYAEIKGTYGSASKKYPSLSFKSIIPKQIFNSGRLLLDFLNIDRVHFPDLSKLNGHYKILRNNPKSKQYLDALIENGRLNVSSDEHWGSKSDGARGMHILKTIKSELHEIFYELGIDKPDSRLYFGQRALTVPNDTRYVLREIRVYNSK